MKAIKRTEGKQERGGKAKTPRYHPSLPTRRYARHCARRSQAAAPTAATPCCSALHCLVRLLQTAAHFSHDQPSPRRQQHIPSTSLLPRSSSSESTTAELHATPPCTSSRRIQLLQHELADPDLSAPATFAPSSPARCSTATVLSKQLAPATLLAWNRCFLQLITASHLPASSRLLNRAPQALPLAEKTSPAAPLSRLLPAAPLICTSCLPPRCTQPTTQAPSGSPPARPAPLHSRRLSLKPRSVADCMQRRKQEKQNKTKRKREI